MLAVPGRHTLFSGLLVLLNFTSPTSLFQEAVLHERARRQANGRGGHPPQRYAYKMCKSFVFDLTLPSFNNWTKILIFIFHPFLTATVSKIIKELLPKGGNVKCSNEARDLILECCVGEFLFYNLFIHLFTISFLSSIRIHPFDFFGSK